MGRFLRRALVIFSAGVVVALALVAVGVAWNDRAEDVCREEATASGYTVTWEWQDFAYVCDYGTADKEQKRVGLVDAFHGEGRRHGPDR